MAAMVFSVTTLTQTAVADTTNIPDTTYLGIIQGGSSTQRINLLEASIIGQAGSSSPTLTIMSRDSTVAGTVSLGSGLTNTFADASTAALAAPPVVGNTASTKPQRDTARHLLNLTINAFGGVYRWFTLPGKEISLIGNTASLGEWSFSAFTGGTPGAVGAHVVYEPL